MTARSHTTLFAKPRRHQHGQALAEAMVVLGALMALLWAVYATGSWQDDSLRAGLAARQAAFAASRLADGADGSFDFNHGDEDIAITFVPVLPDGLPDSAQPGGAHMHAAALRRDWGVGGSAVMAARAELVASQRTHMNAALGKIQSFTRYSVVLGGAGHTGGDTQTHARIAASGSGWQTPAQASMAAAQALDARMHPVDAAWARPALETDWLQKWTDVAPPNLSSQALLAGEPSQLRLPGGSVRSASGESLLVYGLPLRVETFQAPADLVTTADAIARQLDTPPSLSVSAGAWLLSWQSGAQHWAVKLTQPDRARTHGTVSVLRLPEDAVSGTPLLMPAWLPAGARLLFVMADGAGTHAAHTSGQHGVYAHDLPPARLWPLVAQGLRRAGWQGGTGATMPGAVMPDGVVPDGVVHYTRGSRTLALLVVAVPGGSGVVTLETME